MEPRLLSEVDGFGSSCVSQVGTQGVLSTYQQFVYHKINAATGSRERLCKHCAVIGGVQYFNVHGPEQPDIKHNVRSKGLA